MQYNQLFQNKRLQAVLDQLPISVFVADHEGFVVWNNHISAEGIGLSQAEMAGKHVSDLEKQGILNLLLHVSHSNRKSKLLAYKSSMNI
ncbi:PAS domain S-box protein [Geomicrobium sp. JCM 19038]|uniref:PAS domain S-box protein n=1 Tax=Geomicrobium sp. JCM 19038 TaxID=1460635 RepID=UPI0006946B2A|nr:PAS domain S-box protein [Geomicrobium sp. JCM 19038]